MENWLDELAKARAKGVTEGYGKGYKDGQKMASFESFESGSIVGYNTHLLDVIEILETDPKAQYINIDFLIKKLEEIHEIRKMTKSYIKPR